MKTLFDTSVLVPALVCQLKEHSRAYSWLERALAGEFEWVVASHTLAELYAVLTALPISPRIMPAEARRLIGENIERAATVIALTEADYREVLDDLASRSLTGGIVYDALVCQAAKIAKAGRLLTFNVAHFQRIWPVGKGLIQAP